MSPAFIGGVRYLNSVLRTASFDKSKALNLRVGLPVGEPTFFHAPERSRVFQKSRDRSRGPIFKGIRIALDFHGAKCYNNMYRIILNSNKK